MEFPPDIQKTSIALTSSGTINTVTTGTLVAAPGAGFRYRLWAFQAIPQNTVQAVVNWRLFVTDSSATAIPIGAAGSNFASPGLAVIHGGYPFTANTAITHALSSALISLVIVAVVLYTIEAT